MKTNFLQKVLLSIICVNCLFALNDTDLSRKKMRDETARTYDDNKVIETNKTSGDLGRFNYAEVIYEHYKAYQYFDNKKDKAGTTPAKVVSAGYDFYAEQHQQQLQRTQEQIALEQNFQDMQKQPQIAFLQGYCSMPNELTIERIAGYSVLRCDFLEHGQGTLAISVTPDFYSQALVGTPLYVTLSNNQKYTIQNGVILNGARTSINIATSVNDRLIEKIVASTGVTSATIVTKYAQEYLQERKQSREVEEGGDSIISGGNIIQTPTKKNHKEPVKSDYITGATIELASNLIALFGNAYIDSLPYTFKINKDTILYTDLKIDFNERGMRGINYSPTNMIQIDEPKFNKETFEFLNREKAKEILLDDTNGLDNNNNFNARPIPLDKGLNDRGQIR